MANKKNTVCYIDEDLHRKIKAEAAKTGEKLYVVLNGILRKALQKG